MSKDIDLKKHIRSIPDFPKPGILFYDISTLLAHAKAWHATIERLADAIQSLQARRAGGHQIARLPAGGAARSGARHRLRDAAQAGQAARHHGAPHLRAGVRHRHDRDPAGRHQEGRARVVLVDDLLATGGTMAAAVTLLEQRAAASCRRPPASSSSPSSTAASG